MSDPTPPVAPLLSTPPSLVLPPYEDDMPERARQSFLDSASKNIALAALAHEDGKETQMFLELAGLQHVGASACLNPSSKMIADKLRGAELLAQAGSLVLARAVILTMNQGPALAAAMTEDEVKRTNALSSHVGMLSATSSLDVLYSAIESASRGSAAGICHTEEARSALAAADRSGTALDAATRTKLETDVANGVTFSAAFLSVLSTFGTVKSLRTAAALASYLYFRCGNIPRAHVFLDRVVRNEADFATPDLFLPGSPYGDTILDYLTANGVVFSPRNLIEIDEAKTRTDEAKAALN